MVRERIRRCGADSRMVGQKLRVPTACFRLLVVRSGGASHPPEVAPRPARFPAVESGATRAIDGRPVYRHARISRPLATVNTSDYWKVAGIATRIVSGLLTIHAESSHPRENTTQR